jgi:hypothetical protein
MNLKRISVPYSIAGLAGLLIIRILIFPDDGTAATVVIVFFWVVALSLLLKLVAGLFAGEGSWEYLFILVALLAVIVSAILGKDSVGPLTFIVFLLSLLGLAVVWIARRRGHSARKLR